MRARVLLVSVVASWCSAGCGSSAEGERVAVAQLAPNLREGVTKGPLCRPENDGKLYTVDGYLHWPTSGTFGWDDGYAVEMFGENDAEGAGAGQSFSVLIDGPKLLGFGGDIDEPIIHDATTTSTIQGTETSGRVEDDELAVHLADGSKANGSVKVRVTVQMSAGAGGCNYNFVRGTKAG